MTVREFLDSIDRKCKGGLIDGDSDVIIEGCDEYRGYCFDDLREEHIHVGSKSRVPSALYLDGSNLLSTGEKNDNS